MLLFVIAYPSLSSVHVLPSAEPSLTFSLVRVSCQPPPLLPPTRTTLSSLLPIAYDLSKGPTLSKYTHTHPIPQDHSLTQDALDMVGAKTPTIREELLLLRPKEVITHSPTEPQLQPTIGTPTTMVRPWGATTLLVCKPSDPSNPICPLRSSRFPSQETTRYHIYTLPRLDI